MILLFLRLWFQNMIVTGSFEEQAPGLVTKLIYILITYSAWILSLLLIIFLVASQLYLFSYHHYSKQNWCKASLFGKNQVVK